MDRYFASEKEIRFRCKPVSHIGRSAPVSGPTAFSDGLTDYVVADEGHVLCFGGTGAGKTTRIILPTIEKIAKCGESMMIVDPKPEIICRSKELLQEQGYKIIYLNFVDYWRSMRFNLLRDVQDHYNAGQKDEALQRLDEIGTQLFHEHIYNSKDPYWGINGRDLFVGAALTILEYGGRLTIENINAVLNDGKERMGPSCVFAEYVKYKGSHSDSGAKFASRASVPKDTAGCIDSMSASVLNNFMMDGLCDMMSDSDFSFADLANKKTAIFIITPADNGSMDTYVGLLVKQAYDQLKTIALQQPNGRLPSTVHFIIDEFCNFPIPSADRLLTLARGYNERFYLGIQNYGSLIAKYGAEAAHTIWANAEIKYVMRSSDVQLGEILEKLCGIREDPISGFHHPLISVTDIQRLDKERGEVIILIDGLRPFVTTLPSIYDEESRYQYFSIKRLPERIKVRRSPFSFLGIVMDMKKSKTAEMLGI